MKKITLNSIIEYLNLHSALKVLKSWQFWFGLSFLVVAIVINDLSSIYIGQRFGHNLPLLNDLFLGYLPHIKLAWEYDLFAIIPLVIFTIYAAHKKIKSTPYFLLLFGILQILRAFFILLTPVGSPNGTEEGIFKGAAFMFGLYPSGHTGSTFLAFLLADGKYKWVLLCFSILVMIALVLGRGHYSIDIFSAIIFSYAVYEFGKRFQKKMCIN